MRHILLALLIFLCYAPANAAEKLDYGTFGLIPVLHEGRVMPLDSYARLELRELSGKDNYNGKPAIQWLAENLFDPVEAARQPVIFVLPAWRDHLELPIARKYHSLDNLTHALRNYSGLGEALEIADETKLTAQQKELRDLYHKVMNYSELQRSFTALLPLNIPVPAPYETGKSDYSYADFADKAADIRTAIIKLSKDKGADLTKYKDEEKQLVALGFALEETQKTGAENDALPIIYNDSGWFSPWQALQQKRDLKPWQDLASAYRAGDAQNFEAAAKILRGKIPFRLKLERGYNVTEPFHSAMGFYILGLIILAAEIQRRSRRPLFPLICLGAGLFSHVTGIVSRVIILQRPPVGTLYESLLFVSLICAAASAVLYSRRRNFSALFAGMGSAAFLLLLAPYMLREGDGLEPLVAVLNTNFWLGTHVLCITAGYGMCILTALLAHGWLYLRIRNASIDKLMMLQTTIYRLSLTALLLTAIGTTLGGIWADQSWGRFWGWDPKENGALLIVLWLIWVQHGRVSSKLDIVAFTALTAFLNVIVALAWFGVNLLSIGLHSYGFISGIAFALCFFCAAETAIIATLYVLNRKKKNDAPA